ncbi:MAG: hypothetical protein ACM31O_04500 [Bacteroidota bacterium]
MRHVPTRLCQRAGWRRQVHSIKTFVVKPGKNCDMKMTAAFLLILWTNAAGAQNNAAIVDGARAAAHIDWAQRHCAGYAAPTAHIVFDTLMRRRPQTYFHAYAQASVDIEARAEMHGIADTCQAIITWYGLDGSLVPNIWVAPR